MVEEWYDIRMCFSIIIIHLDLDLPRSQGFRSEGLGRGSTFSLDLPIFSTTKEVPSTTIHGSLFEGGGEVGAEAEDEDEDENRQHMDAVYPDSMGHGLNSSAYTREPTRILIVDDSSMNRYIEPA